MRIVLPMVALCALLCSGLACAAGASENKPSVTAGSLRNIAYFTQWGVYGRNYHVRDVDRSGSATKLTHINYAFANVRAGVCEVGRTQPTNPTTGEGGDAYADYQKAYSAVDSVAGVADSWDQPLKGNWNQLLQLKKKYPHLKVLVSLGGWTWSRGFSQAARPENRQRFVASCIDAYIRGNLPRVGDAGGPGAAAGVFDGIDVDWEYPAAPGIDNSSHSPADTENFTALMAEFRRQLDAVRPGLLLTVAVGAGVDKIRVTRPGEYSRYLDFINVMTYDFHGGWEGTTNFHSPLYGAPADPSTGDVRRYNTHDAIQAMKAAGVPAAKLNLGIGFYGRGWTGVSPAAKGLYQAGRPAPGTYEGGIEDYKKLAVRGYQSYRDGTAGAHWIYANGEFWSYDDPANIALKMRYVRDQGLGGAFSWELSGDDTRGTLVQAMSQGLGPR